MAGTTATDFTLIAATVAGMLPIQLPQNLTLGATGVLDGMQALQSTLVDSGGNIISYRGFFRNQTAEQTPAANTDLTINSMDSWTAAFPVRRRNQVFGSEDWAAVASGTTLTLPQAIAQTMSYNFNYNLENFIYGSFLPALLLDSADSPLYDTHVADHSGDIFDYSFIEEAKIPMGDLSDGNSVLIMHPTAYRKANMAAITSNPVMSTTLPEFNATGRVFSGNIAGMTVILSSLIPAISPNVYPTYILGRGSLKLIPQSPFNIESGREGLKAGGTDWLKSGYAQAIGATGLTFGTAVTTGIGGETNDNIATATAWTKTTTKASDTMDDSLIPLSCVIASTV